uniref:Gustatory receptor n=1 Tax=Bursaphelenchus xylophilus TaxID=6326 RepID=A0A1I7S4I7_BURXY
MRHPGEWMITAISLLHTSIYIERSLATKYKHAYEKCGCFLGAIITVVVWTLTVVFNYVAYTVEWDEYLRLNSYCIGVTTHNMEKIRILLGCVLVMDILVTIGEWRLTAYNKKSKVFINYSLSRSYQQGENYLTVRLTAPICLLHSCFFTLFLIIHISVRVLMSYSDGPIRYITWLLMSHNMFVLSLSVCLAMYIYKVRWIQETKKPKDLQWQKDSQASIYFTQFQKQIIPMSDDRRQELCDRNAIFYTNSLFVSFEAFTALCTLPALVMLVCIGVFRIIPLVHINFKWVLTFVLNALVYRLDYQKYSSLNSYCLGITTENQDPVRRLLYFILALDVLVTIGERILAAMNKNLQCSYYPSPYAWQYLFVKFGGHAINVDCSTSNVKSINILLSTLISYKNN